MNHFNRDGDHKKKIKREKKSKGNAKNKTTVTEVKSHFDGLSTTQNN